MEKTIYFCVMFLSIISSVYAEEPSTEYVSVLYSIMKNEDPPKETVLKACPVFNKWAKNKKDKIKALMEWDKQQCQLVFNRDCNTPEYNAKRALVRFSISEHCGVKNE